ncbi:MAG: CAP domain-containing protein, partial [Isosphaeraceae bacterium]
DLLITNDAKAQLIGGAGSNFVNGVWDRPPVASPVMVASAPVPVAPAPVPVAPPLAPAPSSSGLSPIEQQIVDQTNQARVQNGLAPLRVNMQLVQAAKIHAADMASMGLMEHDLPGAALPTLVDRARYVGYNYGWLGENIAYNYPDAYQVTTAWLASPGHRANILNTNFTEIGLGVAYNSRGEAYYCQTFGSSY